MSVQGAVIHWVADHRKHHTFTDEEGDPHSPHTHDAQGWRGVLTGLWHSHMGWLFDGERSSARRFAPDLRKDPLIRKIDSLFPVWALLGLAIPFVARLRALGRQLGRRRDRVRLGRPRARVPAPPRDVERQLDLPHVRQAPVRDRGREPQQLGRRARLARRGLAPHAPRVPDVGEARPPAAPVRSVLRADPPVRAPRLGDQRQAPEARADRGEAPSAPRPPSGRPRRRSQRRA